MHMRFVNINKNSIEYLLTRYKYCLKTGQSLPGMVYGTTRMYYVL